MKLLYCQASSLFVTLASLHLFAMVRAASIPSSHPTRDSSLVQRNSSCLESISRMPEGAWDSHLHIIDPGRYPLSPNAEYNIGTYTVWDNAQFEDTIGGDHITMIQPSVYENDNTVLLQALMAYGPDRARAVVMFEAGNVTTAQLQHWHELGVRGVRINVSSSKDEISAEKLRNTMKKYADIIRPMGWVLQLYIPMTTIAKLEDVVPTLGVQVVFDHFGNPTMPEPSCNPQKLDPYTIEGFGALVRLLKQGNTWVKISGAYRLSKLDGPEWTDLDPLAKELFAVADDKLVFATDWPHTRFEGLDIKPWVEHLLDLTEGDETLRQRLFRDNAKRLWGYED